MDIDNYLETPYIKPKVTNGINNNMKSNNKKINKDKVEIIRLKKQVRELKLDKPIEKITIEMPDSTSWKETVSNYREMFLERPDYFQGPQGVFNYSMSPRELLDHFLTPQQVKLEGSKLMEKTHKISNSTLNRKPSTNGELFLNRHFYCFNIVTGYADMNFFPLSMIDNRDIEKAIYHIMLKDRGNLTYILKKGEEAILTVNQWNSILGGMDDDDKFNQYLLKCERYLEILNDAKDNLSQYHSSHDRENQKLSLKEVVGDDVYTEWLDAPQGINLRCKWETLGVHTNEMQKYNNNETNWIEYNFLNTSLGIKGYYQPEEIADEALAEIHNLCVDNDVFVGNKTFLKNVKYQNSEGFESWFIIENVANSDGEWNTFINTVVRNAQTPTKRQLDNWEKLFSKKEKDKKGSPKKKNGAYIFKTYE